MNCNIITRIIDGEFVESFPDPIGPTPGAPIVVVSGETTVEGTVPVGGFGLRLDTSDVGLPIHPDCSRVRYSIRRADGVEIDRRYSFDGSTEADATGDWTPGESYTISAQYVSASGQSMTMPGPSATITIDTPSE